MQICKNHKTFIKVRSKKAKKSLVDIKWDIYWMDIYWD